MGKTAGSERASVIIEKGGERERKSANPGALEFQESVKEMRSCHVCSICVGFKNLSSLLGRNGSRSH